MGADIHAVLERRIDGKWIGIHNFPYLNNAAAEISFMTANWKQQEEKIPKEYYIFWRALGRNYELFGNLANVRNPGPEPRGIPDDISDLARFEIDGWSSDGHSHSWGLLSEIGGLFMAAYFPSQVFDKSRYDRVGSFFGISDLTTEKTLSQYRLVYWFDN